MKEESKFKTENGPLLGDGQSVNAICDVPGTVDSRDRILVITSMLQELHEIVSSDNSWGNNISYTSHVFYVCVVYYELDVCKNGRMMNDKMK